MKPLLWVVLLLAVVTANCRRTYSTVAEESHWSDSTAASEPHYNGDTSFAAAGPNMERLGPSSTLGFPNDNKTTFVMDEPAQDLGFARERVQAGCHEGFLSLFGTHKCVKVFDDVDRNWYDANLKCRSEGLTMVKTSNVNALNIRQALVNLLGDAGSYAWLDAEFNGVQYVWGDGEVIANDNSLWYTPYINLKPGYCMGLLNSQTFIDRSPSTAYYGTLCNAIAHGRKAFCEYDNCPANCEHGSCNNGVCYCQPGYTGPKCSEKYTDEECSDIIPGFFPLPGTSKCGGIFDEDIDWYGATKKCLYEGCQRGLLTLKKVKTNDNNAVEIRKALITGKLGFYGWLDARYNGVQYQWSDGEVIDNLDKLWYPGHPHKLHGYCLLMLNTNYYMGPQPIKPYYSVPCTETSTRKAFCEFDPTVEKFHHKDW